MMRLGFDGLREEVIGALLHEVHQAVRGGMRRLAAMGVRSLIEQLMISKVGDLGACLGNGPSRWFETVHGLGGLIAHDLTLLRWRA
jgi:hypothetical protein